MIITICSSIDFTPKIIEIKKSLESMGHTVNIPYSANKIMEGKISYEKYVHLKNSNGDSSFRESDPVDLIERYWTFIKNSDAILVLNMTKNGIEGYIGGSVLMEMGFAYGQKKRIYMFNPIPKRSERMHYVDEIIAMKPVLVDGDLDKIV
jgi:hypothetical protein